MNSTPSNAGSETAFPGKVATDQRHSPKLTLVYYPDPVLRTVCQPVNRFDSTLSDLVQEMFSLMLTHTGIGLAGPQAAIEQRVFVSAIQGHQFCLTNPEILEAGKPGEFVEGCLSLPDVRISVARPEHIRVSGYDVRGYKVGFSATGLWARVIQHELDHLNGILISDRGEPPCQPCGAYPLVPATLVEERKHPSRHTRKRK